MIIWCHDKTGTCVIGVCHKSFSRLLSAGGRHARETNGNRPPAAANAVTHANGFIDASQAKAYDDIVIAPGPKM